MTHLLSIITDLAFLMGVAATPASEIFTGGDMYGLSVIRMAY